jgi:hypothetical protein
MRVTGQLSGGWRDRARHVEMDLLRAIALGRKNYLFVGNEDADEDIAGLYSLVATCEANRVNPLAYLCDVLLRISSHPATRIDELLPDRRAPAPNRTYVNHVDGRTVTPRASLSGAERWSAGSFRAAVVRAKRVATRTARPATTRAVAAKLRVARSSAPRGASQISAPSGGTWTSSDPSRTCTNKSSSSRPLTTYISSPPATHPLELEAIPKNCSSAAKPRLHRANTRSPTLC